LIIHEKPGISSTHCAARDFVKLRNYIQGCGVSAVSASWVRRLFIPDIAGSNSKKIFLIFPVD
jgi:hypothetical protein